MISIQNGKDIVSAQAMSGSFNSSYVNISQCAGFYVQVISSGTSVSGTFAITCNGNISTGTNPNSALYDTVTSAVISATGSQSFNVPSQFYPFFRVSWTNANSSSDSAMTVTTFVKG